MYKDTYEVGASNVVVVTFSFLLFNHPFQKSTTGIDKPIVR